ncbi:MAG: DHH family phosphoesterase [Halobacteriaceae archaeon]
MDEDVIDDSDLSLERKSLLPGTGFFVPDEIQRERRDAEIRDRIADADVVVVADPDADGLGSVAVIREVYEDAALIPAGPNELDDGLRRAATYSTADRVFVCDLSPDAFDRVADPLTALLDSGTTVHWYDHHQWPDAVADAVREAGVDLVVGDSEEECTVDVVFGAMDYAFPDRLFELAAVTRDHDLWIKDDPRSDDIADYAYWVEDYDEYITTVRDHGADLPDPVMTYLEERRVEKEALIDRAVDRADLHTIGEWTVGITYGRCSQNEVAETLRVEADADAAVIVKPSGAASIRGSPTFERCHEVARQVNGGGHPRAAGCKPDLYDDVLDYAHHWVTQGAVAKQTLLEAFATLPETPAE